MNTVCVVWRLTILCSELYFLSFICTRIIGISGVNLETKVKKLNFLIQNTESNFIEIFDYTYNRIRAVNLLRYVLSSF